MVQAKWFVYSPQAIPLGVFDDNYFHDLLNGVALFAAGKEAIVPHLTRNTLKAWIVAEFNAFLLIFGYCVAEGYNQAGSVPFMQFIHDGVTMANREKYQALGVQFIFALNGVLLQMVICIGFIRSETNTDSDLHTRFGKVRRVLNELKQTFARVTHTPHILSIARSHTGRPGANGVCT